MIARAAKVFNCFKAFAIRLFVKVTQKKPMLLLDDVFDKLDDERVERITKLLTDPARFGQVFITDARKERTSLLVKDKYKTKIFELENGKVNSYET